MTECTDILLQKRAARRLVVARRDEIPEEERARRSQAICAQLIDLLGDVSEVPLTLPGTDSVLSDCPYRVAVYQAMGSEVDLDEFIRVAYARGKVVCFPCMTKTPSDADDMEKPWLKARQMLFFEVTEEDYFRQRAPFLSNPLELCEYDDPRLAELSLVEPESLDMVVVPAVAFDRNNYRLGYGGGNYDGFLSRVCTSAASYERSPLVVGCAFKEQELETVPREKHDLQLPAIISA